MLPKTNEKLAKSEPKASPGCGPDGTGADVAVGPSARRATGRAKERHDPSPVERPDPQHLAARGGAAGRDEPRGEGRPAGQLLEAPHPRGRRGIRPPAGNLR